MANRFYRSIVVLVSMFFVGAMLQAEDLASFGFTYTVSKGKVTITGMVQDSFKGVLSIPEKVEGSFVTAIGDFAFDHLTGVTGLVLPEAVSVLGESAFEGCTSLAWVQLGAKVEVIGPAAFAGCTALAGLTLPDKVETIGEGSFAGCVSLAEVDFGKKVETIDASAFQGCVSLTSVMIPSRVESIGANAFEGCGSLVTVSLGKSVEWLDDRAFYDCTNLLSVTFLGDLPSLGVEVFGQAEQATVYYVDGSAGWEEVFGGLPSQAVSYRIDRDSFSAGLPGEGFGFTVNGPLNATFVVEACDALNGSWTPLATNVLTTGSVSFVDKDSRNHASRFYRVLGL